jgi:two-component system sensor histidine kinase HydH
MVLRDYPLRVLVAACAASVLFLVLCGISALFLYREQSRIAEVVGENVESQRAAIGLQEILTALAASHERLVPDVKPLQDRAQARLTEIESFADKSEERELAHQVALSYQHYREMWRNAQGHADRIPMVVHHLEEDTLPACRRLENFNTSQVQKSQREHRESLDRMIEGLAAVGGLASIGGLVLGWGLSRGLRRTIHQVLVRIQGAAELLGPEGTTLEVPREATMLGPGADEMLHRVEQVVVRLQERERELRRAERLAALGQLAAGVAHEIRNPLTAALLLFQAARKDPTAGGLTEEDLDLIEQELHRIEKTLKVFLDFARPPQLSRSECDLKEIVRAAATITRGRAELQKVAIELNLPAEPCPLFADREQLYQVVLNLMLNALDAMSRGGKLTAAIAANPGFWELTIADNGAGISPHMRAKLFEPFATGKDTGLGLGLYTSKRIVEEHQGTIQGENLPGGGAVFRIRLPRP